MPRTTALALGALAALSALAVACLPWLIDANAFRSKIEQSIAARLGWSVRINGHLRLSVLPDLAIELPLLTVANGEQARPFARFERARVSVGLLPLLFGRLEVTGIRITRLEASVERRPSGGTNIDQLLAVLAPRGRAWREADGNTVTWTSAPIELEDAKLTVVVDGGTVMTLSKLNLVTGAMEPGRGIPIRLSGLVQAATVPVQAGLAISGTLDFGFSEAGFAVRDLMGFVAGSIAGERVEAAIRSPRILLGRTVAVDEVNARLSVEGSRKLRLQIGVAGIEGLPQRASVRGLRVDASVAHGGNNTTAARLSADAVLALQDGILRLSEFAGQLTLTEPAIAARALDVQINGTGVFDPAGRYAELEFDARSAANSFRARGGLTGFTRPRLRLDLDADQLDFDAILAGLGRRMGASRPGKIDLSVLRNLDIVGLGRIGKLQWAGASADDARVEFQAGPGGLNIALAASLYGGKCQGRGYVTGDGGSVGMQVSLEGVAVEPLLRATAGRDELEGTADLTLELAAPLQDGKLRPLALGGRVSVRIRDGAVRGFDLARSVCDGADKQAGRADDAKSMDRGLQTKFDQLSATFAVADGVARNEDLSAQAKQLRIAGEGTIELAAEKVDFALRLSQQPDSGGTARRGQGLLRAATIPVRIAGGREGIGYSICRTLAGERAVEEAASLKNRSTSEPTASIGSGR